MITEIEAWVSKERLPEKADLERQMPSYSAYKTAKDRSPGASGAKWAEFPCSRGENVLCQRFLGHACENI